MEKMSVKFSLPLVLMIMILLQIHGYRSCLDTERVALLELKAFLKSVTDASVAEKVLVWPDDDIENDCCCWERIKCNVTTGRIVELSLNYSVSAYRFSLLNLSLLHPFEELQSLDLSGNYLTGWFDPVEGSKSFARLKKLEVLHISDNWFNGSILHFLSAATSLRTLNLASNRMEGFRPLKELENLRNLRELDISDNPFSRVSIQDLSNFKDLEGLGLSGVLSLDDTDFEIFARLKKLKALDISYNSLNNTTLHSLSAATSLRTLYLGYNNIEGVFPPKELANLRSLRVLDVSANKFSSISIQELANLTKLEALDLSFNDFAGNLQIQGICGLQNLQELDLSNTIFTGQLPQCLRNLTKLRTLDASYYSLTGNLPSVLGDVTSLECLSLDENNFEGSFSFSSLANLTKLEIFSLSSNHGMLQLKDQSSWLPTFQLKVLLLPSSNLMGAMPSFLLHQYDLRIVDLSNNKLSETFPNWLLQNNSKLEVLDLRNNSLFADLQLTKAMLGLRGLDVSHNKITGSLLENFGMLLPKLEYLHLSENFFQGGIPSSMGELKMLKFLSLSNNNFSGELPKNFVRGCHSLTRLILSNNRFTGMVFPEYANLKHLEMLLLDNNNFTHIGKGLLNSVSLHALDISNNMLSGRIPSWISRLPLAYLLMGKNKLEGAIPVQVRHFTQLNILDLSENNLSGFIPLFNFTYLQHLFLNDNHLVGSIPNSLFESKYLETLNLGNNNLSGQIPKSISKLPYLSVLLLRRNKMLGPIPGEICQLSQVRMLDLSWNRLNGSVPLCLNNLSFGNARYTSYPLVTYELFDHYDLDDYYKYMSTFHRLSKNIPADDLEDEYAFIVQFTTKRRYESFKGGILGYMSGLDLSNNEFTGEIPTQIGDLQALRALNLSHNHLSGLIPDTFFNMKSIESLDLSYNKLHGNIPPQLAELDTLGFFNISYNDFSGRIPFNDHLVTFDDSSYIGNPGLCGPPTKKNCSNTEVPTITSTQDLPEKDGGGAIDMLWFYWSCSASYVMTLVGLFMFLCIDSQWSRTWFYLVDVCVYRIELLKHRLFSG